MSPAIRQEKPFYLKTKKTQITEPTVILKDFSLDYLGWESHTSPEIKVVKVQDEAALQDATQAAKTTFMDWQTSSLSEQKLNSQKKY